MKTHGIALGREIQDFLHLFELLRGTTMNLRNRIASILASLIICASFGAAQQTAVPAPSTAPQPERFPIANRIVLETGEPVAPAPSSTPALLPSPAAQTELFPIANHIQLVIEGKVINVHDGDTVTVLDPYNQKFHIRLHGIDAPELKQSFGSVSQQNLSRLVLGKEVEIYWNKVDKYRRTVGTIMLDGRDVNIEQVKGGFAWHFKKYEEEQPAQDRITYSAAEQKARAANLGLWQEHDPGPTPPGEWRQAVKAKRWGPPPPPGTIIGNKNSLKYHRPDCAGYRDMAEKNRVFFPSVAEAEAAGYKRAGNCPAQGATAGATVNSALSTPVGNAVASSAPVANPVSANSVPTSSPAITPATGETVPAADASDDAPPTDDAVADGDEGDEADADATPAATSPTAGQAPAVISPGSTGTASAQPNGFTASTAAATGPIIGNRNSKVYHLPGCASYNRVSEKNQVKFATVAEAEQAGYKLAGNCSKR
jgi:endonuclease YncB( thermonuclease family)